MVRNPYYEELCSARENAAPSPETTRVIRDAINALPEVHRVIVLLRFVEHLSSREIGRRLAMSKRRVVRLLIESVFRIHKAVCSLEDAAPASP